MTIAYKDYLISHLKITFFNSVELADDSWNDAFVDVNVKYLVKLVNSK